MMIFTKLINNTSASVNINCTAVDGKAGVGTPIYVTKTTTIAANDTIVVFFNAVDFGTATIDYPQYNCGLPPGTGIGYTGTNYIINVGA